MSSVSDSVFTSAGETSAVQSSFEDGSDAERMSIPVSLSDAPPADGDDAPTIAPPVDEHGDALTIPPADDDNSPTIGPPSDASEAPVSASEPPASGTEIPSRNQNPPSKRGKRRAR
jgi:hypothetical protein